MRACFRQLSQFCDNYPSTFLLLKSLNGEYWKHFNESEYWLNENWCVNCDVHSSQTWNPFLPAWQAGAGRRDRHAVCWSCHRRRQSSGELWPVSLYQVMWGWIVRRDRHNGFISRARPITPEETPSRVSKRVNARNASLLPSGLRSSSQFCASVGSSFGLVIFFFLMQRRHHATTAVSRTAGARRSKPGGICKNLGRDY
jgi:hypothetical protein